MSVFNRIVDIESIKDKVLADLSPQDLAGFVTHAYPADPIGATTVMYRNLEIGFILYRGTLLLLEGAGYVKTERNF